MPNKNHYPEYFNPLSRPQFYGIEPKKTLEQKTGLSDYVSYSSNNLLVLIPENATAVEVDASGGRYDGEYEVHLTFFNVQELKNPKYEKELERYNKEKSNFEIRLKKWDVLKAKWDKEDKEERESAELALYEKLKKKFEK